MTKPSARSGIGAATTLHAITALLLILIGAKIARTLPFASGVCIMLILAMPAILAAGFAEATRRKAIGVADAEVLERTGAAEAQKQLSIGLAQAEITEKIGAAEATKTRAVGLAAAEATQALGEGRARGYAAQVVSLGAGATAAVAVADQ